MQQRRPEPDDQASFTAGYPGVVTPHTWYSLYSLSVYVHLPRLQAEADQRIAGESRWFGQRPAGSGAAAYLPLPKGTLLRAGRCSVPWRCTPAPCWWRRCRCRSTFPAPASPLYWTSPWPPPPAQLAHLHFAALDLAALSSVTGQQ